MLNLNLGNPSMLSSWGEHPKLECR
jgi:hypothetical protein